MSMGSSSEDMKEHLKGITFSRMNNSLNAVEGAANFGYTPVFTYYKKGYKTQPYILRPTYMSFGILEDFLTLTRDMGVYDSSVVDSAFDANKLA